MSHPLSTILSHRATSKLYYGVDWSPWLRAGDTVSSCTVSVISGTATVATTPGGTGAASQSAGVSGAITSTALVSASPGLIGLKWAVSSTAGETDVVVTEVHAY